MATDLDASFNEKFMNINMKLKKRFLRKPNLSEAANEFIALAIQAENSEQPAFAGHAYVGAAKCEATAGNTSGEADHYITAARQFMKAEKKLREMKFYSPDREHLEAAISYFIQALHKYPEKSPLRASILMELSNDLVTLGHKVQALAYYEQALENVTENAMKLFCLRHKVNLEIDCGNYDVALETANSVIDSNLKTNMPKDIMTEFQVSRILLSLVINQPEDNKPASLHQLFTDLMNDVQSELIPFNADLQLKLQSIVATTLSGDAQTLVGVAGDARRAVTSQQQHLLHELVVAQREKHLALT